MRQKLVQFSFAALSFGLVFACGESAQQGGDHIPDFKVYTVASLPDSAQATGLQAHEVNSRYLQSYVYLNETYNVCLTTGDFTEATLAAYQTNLSLDSGKVFDYGLEGIVNYTLSSVRQYQKDRKDFTSRVEIKLIWENTKDCDFLVIKADSAEFPFSNGDFLDRQSVAFVPGQLKDASASNKIPVGYIVSGKGQDQEYIDLQLLVAQLVGLGASSEDGSYLNTDTTSGSKDLGWHLISDDGVIKVGDDSLILYTFALLYQDILKPEDLGTFQHYLDELQPAGDKDPDLSLPKSTNISFTNVIGDPHIHGARNIQSTVKICTENLSDETISDSAVDGYLAFADVATTDRLFYLLKDLDDAFSPNFKTVTESCNLFLSFRKSDQYPFNSKNYNGMYAHEGTVKDKDGRDNKIPVIYLNASNLELVQDDSSASGKKYIGYVLEHEFAHFLGFHHSSSNESILSPAGYHDEWDMDGGDSDMFKAYLKQWKKNVSIRGDLQ